VKQSPTAACHARLARCLPPAGSCLQPEALLQVVTSFGGLRSCLLLSLLSAICCCLLAPCHSRALGGLVCDCSLCGNIDLGAGLGPAGTCSTLRWGFEVGSTTVVALGKPAVAVLSAAPVLAESCARIKDAVVCCRNTNRHTRMLWLLHACRLAAGVDHCCGSGFNSKRSLQ
jgi:hypothetical protein